ncbi:MAG: TlpA family protein disulfide reductase [Acidimicrobiales bacterium]
MTSVSQPRADAPAPRRPYWLIAAIGAVIVLAALAAFLVSRRGNDAEETATAVPGGVLQGEAAAPGAAETAPVRVEGTALRLYPDSGPDTAIGQRAPSVSGTNLLTGQTLQIPADGRPKLIVFLAHWCPHCQREAPVIQRWLDAGRKPAGVDLYAVSTGVRPESGNYPPSQWLSRLGWSVPTLADQAAPSSAGVAAQAFGLSGFPYFVAVDAAGNVAARRTGELGAQQLEALVGALAR